MLQKIKKNTKSGRISALLKKRIRDGIYTAGEQLPSCRCLSKEFDVSYGTANRALKDLVRLGIVRNYQGKGVYVPSFEMTNQSIRKVKIFGSVSVTPAMVQYRNEVPMVLKESGWSVSLFFLDKSIEAIRPELEDEDSFFVFYGISDSESYDFFELIIALGIEKRVILLGKYGNQYGISSIVTDERRQIRMAMDLLLQAGCKKIGLFEGNPEGDLDQERLVAWRNYYSKGSWSDYLLKMELPSLDKTGVQYVIDFLKKIYRQGRFRKMDGILFLDSRIAGASAGVFKDLGIRIPEELSVVVIGDANFLTFVRPKMTAVDLNMKGHIQVIVKILEDKFNGENHLPLLYLCEPKIIKRDSVKKQRSVKKREKVIYI